MQSVELVTFRTVSIDAARFVDVNAPLNDWLKRQPGFVARHLAEKDDGRWIDIVFWQSHEAALAASQKLGEEMGQSEAIAAIDPTSIGISHATVRLSFD